MSSATTDSPESAPLTRVALVDDHGAIRIGVAALLAREFEIVASAARVPDILVRTTDIDVAVLDLRLQDGSTVTQNIALLHSVGARVLIFTSGDNPELVREAARSGVAGAVRKSDPIEGLLSAVRVVAAGGIAATTEWAAALDADTSIRDAGLTNREREVLALYASGEQADRVSELLFISRETVAVHVKRIRAKYAAAGRAAPTKVHLLKRAIEDGLV